MTTPKRNQKLLKPAGHAHVARLLETEDPEARVVESVPRNVATGRDRQNTAITMLEIQSGLAIIQTEIELNEQFQMSTE